MGITPIFPIAGQKFRRYFEVYLCFFAVFQNSYVFIPVMVAEPQTIFCGTPRFRGTMYEKHRYVGGCYEVFTEIVRVTPDTNLTSKHVLYLKND
jgi:hypothetical protein